MIDLSEKIMKSYRGEIELIVRDRHGRLIDHVREQNIIKIDAKEILSHRLSYSKVWDPLGGSGDGAWVSSGLDIDELAVKYIVFGASFDANGGALDAADARFYAVDSVTGNYVPKTLTPGAEYDGGLINAIPLSEPNRPLKRIERIYFESSYQPSGSPLLQDDVRALNNVVVFETTLTKDEYNGFGTTDADFFTITEIALVGAKEINTVGETEINPRDVFLTGSGGTANNPFAALASGTATITIDPSEALVDHIKEGDRIKIVSQDATNNLDQINPYYLVTDKAIGGRDITLDRTPTDSDNVAITGSIGVLRDGFRIFSHRILRSPVKKSADFTITARWRIAFN